MGGSGILMEEFMRELVSQLSAYDEAALDAAFGTLTEQVRSGAAGLTSAEAKEEFRLEWLGRKQGRLKAVSDVWLKTAPMEAKRALGQRAVQGCHRESCLGSQLPSPRG